MGKIRELDKTLFPGAEGICDHEIHLVKGLIYFHQETALTPLLLTILMQKIGRFDSEITGAFFILEFFLLSPGGLLLDKMTICRKVK